jgi:hypothetical protein
MEDVNVFSSIWNGRIGVTQVFSPYLPLIFFVPLRILKSKIEILACENIISFFPVRYLTSGD